MLHMDLSQSSLMWIKSNELMPVLGVDPHTTELLASQIPVIRNPGILSDSAIVWAAICHPPLVKKQRRRCYRVIGNVRSAHLCRQLPASTRFPVVVLPESLAHSNTADFLIKTTLISTLCYGLDVAFARDSVLGLIQRSSKSSLADISTELLTRSGVERVLGLNRRYTLPQRQYVSSPTSQASLDLGEAE